VAQELNSHSGMDQISGGALYVVATPIGNLRDITLRALDVLQAADVIAAEDTRHSRALLQHHVISSRLFALHEHNERTASEKIVAWLREGKAVALVSDAGTPAISDPGAVLVQRVREAGFPVVPIPGPSALIAALSASGIAQTAFRFCGFLPGKGSERRALLASLAQCADTMVFYEAPHRIVAAMRDIAASFGEGRSVVLCRELTKRYETIHHCLSGEAVGWLEADDNQQRGEFVVIVEGRQADESNSDDAKIREVLSILLEELPVKQAVALATKITGAKRNAVYAAALELKGKAP
jgi:16S rRNA (cytidine1402-2'-O)-methyltransferase